jgi:hypothetical protein
MPTMKAVRDPRPTTEDCESFWRPGTRKRLMGVDRRFRFRSSTVSGTLVTEPPAGEHC